MAININIPKPPYTTAEIPDSVNLRYVTDAELTVIQNTSGTNTGDQNLSGLVPYTGATANVELGAFNIEATTIIKTGGAASEFLMADGTTSLGGSKFAIIGNPVVITASSLTRFISPYQTTASIPEIARSLVIPFAVTINKFFIGTSGTQPASGSSILTLRKNGVATLIVITISAGSAAGIFSDLTNSVSFAAGDLISIQHVNNATSNAAQITQISISE